MAVPQPLRLACLDVGGRRRFAEEFEEIAARCRHLELTNRHVSPELRERWGLVARIATHNDITTDLELIGDTVYAGTSSGWLARHLASTLKEGESPLRAVALSETMPDSLRGATSATVQRPRLFQAGFRLGRARTCWPAASGSPTGGTDRSEACGT